MTVKDLKDKLADLPDDMDEIYFEKEPTDSKEQRRRSKGLDRYRMNGMKDLDVIKAATTDFTNFIKQLSPSKK